MDANPANGTAPPGHPAAPAGVAARPHPLTRWARPFARHFVRPPAIHLTFDDGPHPTFTPIVLDRLDRFGVTATFFVLGERVRRFPELAREIVRRGHRLGNHTQTHPQRPGVRQAFAEIRQCQRAVTEATGAAPVAFRPPYGRMTLGLRWAALRHRLPVWMWSLDSRDWVCRTAEDADRCAASVAAAARPGDVILFHDANEWIGAVLDGLLPVVGRPHR